MGFEDKQGGDTILFLFFHCSFFFCLKHHNENYGKVIRLPREKNNNNNGSPNSSSLFLLSFLYQSFHPQLFEGVVSIKEGLREIEKKREKERKRERER